MLQSGDDMQKTCVEFMLSQMTDISGDEESPNHAIRTPNAEGVVKAQRTFGFCATLAAACATKWWRPGNS